MTFDVRRTISDLVSLGEVCGFVLYIIMYAYYHARMRLYSILVLLTANLALHGQAVPEANDPNKQTTRTNSSFVELIGGKPIDHYLKDDRVSQIAKMFYKGQWAISDDEGTFGFLDSVLTDNTDTRPFYFLVFNQALKISDGAVSEYISTVCSRFLAKYPCEFIAMSGDKKYNLDIEKWTDFIGFDLYDSSNYTAYIADIERKVKRSCGNEVPEWDRLSRKLWDKLEEK